MNEEEEKNKKNFGTYILYIERKTRVALYLQRNVFLMSLLIQQH